MKPGERLAALEGLRGYAALLVFLVHAFGVLAVRLYGIDPDNHSLWGGAQPVLAVLMFLHRSHYGVDLFFVLSGLLMTDLAVRRWPGVRQFLARRWLRIYPAYALSTLAFAAVALLWAGRDIALRDALGNAFLVQGFFVLGLAALNPVSWSLSFEAAFYLAVPLLVAAFRRGTPPTRATWFTLAAAFTLILLAAGVAATPKAIYMAYFALFVPGIALGLLDDATRDRLAARLPLSAVVAAWVAFTLAFKLEGLANTQVAYYAASGCAGALLVLKACDAAGALARLLATAPARWLGRYSYSFFLIHYLVVHLWGDAVAQAVPAGQPLVHAAVFLAGALAGSLAAARLLYAASERYYFTRS
jgi:exopolysaccharide production protein ExoZ